MPDRGGAVGAIVRAQTANMLQHVVVIVRFIVVGGPGA